MESTPIRIVEASPADLGRLYSLASTVLALDTFSEALLHEKLFFNSHPDRHEYHTLMAEVDGEPVGMLQHVIAADEGHAWLGLFGVAERYRRRHIGRRLYESALGLWNVMGVGRVDVMTIPANYLVPGLDPRYTGALCFVESLGFVFTGERSNLRVRLDWDFDTADRETELKAHGIEVRRASPDDADLIERFFARYFGAAWLAETQLAMSRRPPGVHLALRDDEIIAFAAHSTMNAEWGNFGPMGTADADRGKGIGQVLLYRCMADLAAAGFHSAVIPWIGPYRFYCNRLDCAIERVFWQYRLELAVSDDTRRT